MGKIWCRLTDCLESVPMSYLSLSFNYRKWVVEAEKRLDSIRGIVTSKRMHAWFAVFSTIHSRILLTECASESLYSVQNIVIHRIRLIFDSSNTLVYRLGPKRHGPASVRNLFSRLHWSRGRSIPGSWMVGSLINDLLETSMIWFYHRVHCTIWPTGCSEVRRTTLTATSKNFQYLGSVIDGSGGCGKDVDRRMTAA